MMPAMPIQHHLQPETLLAYAAGTLPEAFSLMVASHVSLCDDCRATVESYDAVGGALIETEDTCDLSADCLAHTLARIETAAPPPARPRQRGTLPGPLQDYVGGDLDAVKWRSIGMGVKQAILPTARGAMARLLLIPAGTAMPDHGHHGTEMTLVLQGAFYDEGDRFARGDIEIADGSVSHTPVADVGEDCICLAVTDAPLKFTGWMPRVVQKFARI